MQETPPIESLKRAPTPVNPWSFKSRNSTKAKSAQDESSGGRTSPTHPAIATHPRIGFTDPSRPTFRANPYRELTDPICRLP